MNSELALPNFTTMFDPITLVRQAQDRGLLAASSAGQYIRGLQGYMRNGDTPLWGVESIVSHSYTLAGSPLRTFKSAIKLWIDEIELWLLRNDTPEMALATQAATNRLKSIKLDLAKGSKAKAQDNSAKGIWLSRKEVVIISKALTKDTPLCKRNKLMFYLMYLCGLRRSEIAALRFSDLEFKGDRPVLIINGKGRGGMNSGGGKVRTVPADGRIVAAMAEWQQIIKAPDDSLVMRSFNRDGTPKDSMPTATILKTAQMFGRIVGRKTTPHDYRRTFAQLCYSGGQPIIEIRDTLGHTSVQTTEKYLQMGTNLINPGIDTLPS